MILNWLCRGLKELAREKKFSRRGLAALFPMAPRGRGG